MKTFESDSLEESYCTASLHSQLAAGSLTHRFRIEVSSDNNG
jgi:hypothetical protein